jgi:hypothetical protein
MTKTKGKTGRHQGVRLEGWTRIALGKHMPDGSVEVIGDSGFVGPNQVTDSGFSNFICAALGSLAGSSYVSYMALGTGTVPASNATALAGETGTRKAVNNSIVASHTLQVTASWASSDNPGLCTLQNVGLFAVSTAGAGTLFAGNTYATSQWSNNQGVSATYQLRFATS